MRPSLALVEFVAAWESLRLRAYLDGGGVPTIGYGHTRGVQLGDECDEMQAQAWLETELDDYGVDLLRYMERDPSQQQYDALLSLSFNCGTRAIGESGVMARFNAGLDQECADRFLLWSKDNGKVIRGLVRRREGERAIYLFGQYDARP